jgi:hypothetical protein
LLQLNQQNSAHSVTVGGVRSPCTMYITFICYIHVLMQYRHFPVPANSCLPHCTSIFHPCFLLYPLFPYLQCSVPASSNKTFIPPISGTEYSSTCPFTRPIFHNLNENPAKTQLLVRYCDSRQTKIICNAPPIVEFTNAGIFTIF